MQAMWKRFRHHLWLIHYYSADRPRTAWSKSRDAALALTGLLAIAAVWTTDRFIERHAATQSQDGGLIQSRDGTLRAVLKEYERDRIPWAEGRAIGEFVLIAHEKHAGWPLLTARRDSTLRIDLRRFDQPDVQLDASLDPNDPIAAAIDQAIARNGFSKIRAASQRVTPESTASPGGWMMNMAIWWVVLYAVAMLLLGVMRIGVAIHARRVNRRERTMISRGLCVHCGYDMRGLEFNERCPECGELVE